MNNFLGWNQFNAISFKQLFTASLLTLILVLAGCGGGGDDKPKEQDPPRAVTGSGVKGPLISAIVTVYAIDYSASDFKGAVIASGTTDNAAQITGVALPLPLTPPYLMEISTDADTIDITTLTDPTDLTTGSAPVISTLRTIITDDMLSSGIDLYATPQTTIATDIALMGKTDNASMLAALPDAASVVMSALGFGASASVDIFNTPPLINAATDTTAEQTVVAEYRLAIEALTAVVFNAANAVGGTTTPDSLLADLIIDLADGVIDTLDPDAIAALTADPTTLTIPNTSKSLVTDITTTLVEEKATTGSTTSTTELEPGGSISPAPLPAETDTDIDGDTFLNIEDNCPTISNDQTDVNSNGMGDACEPAIIVPDVVGQTQAIAESTITSAGLTVGSITNAFDNSIAAGSVISQSPVSGSDSLESLPVDLVISDGPAPVDVPNVVGMTNTTATSALEALGLVVVENRVNDAAAINQVIAQEPTATTTVAVGSTVTITVSDGPVMVDVLNVVGMTNTAATSALEALGLVVAENRVNNAAAIDEVISQNPTATTTVAVGSTVTITVSDGPVMVDVPNVVGMTNTAATSNLEALGLVVVENRVNDAAAIDEVISQNPTATTTVAVGSTVTITVSDGPVMVDVPNVIGMTNTAATSALETLGLVVVENRVNDAAAINEVIDQDPTATTTVAIGTTVTITVSDGPVMVDVPNVVGMSNSAATAALEALGLVVVENRVTDAAPVNEVIAQDPTATTSVAVGSTVTITVSDNPVMLDVPNVVGMTNTAATSALEALGLVVVENRIYDTATIDQVIAQDPSATTSVAVGSTVTITVSDGPFTGPDVSGIWSIRVTSIDTPTSCATSGGPGNAEFLQANSTLKSYMTITQTSSSLSLSFLNGITTSGVINPDESINITDGVSATFPDAAGLATSSALSFSGVNYISSTTTIEGTVVNTSTNGASTCDQTLSFSAEYVYTPTGTENYDGLYQLEVIASNEDLDPWRINATMQFEFSGTPGSEMLKTGNIDETFVTSTVPIFFNRTNGFAFMQEEIIKVVDRDEDGVDDDLEVSLQNIFLMYPRSPDETSGLPIMVFTGFTTYKQWFNTTVYTPGSMPAPDFTENEAMQGYARTTTSTAITRSNHVPLTSGIDGDYVTMGITHPPLIIDPDGSVEIVDAADGIVCSTTYLGRYTQRYNPFPSPSTAGVDMSVEAFDDTAYSWLTCPIDTTAITVIDGDTYTMNIKDSVGTIQYTYPIVATPTTFATTKPSRRQVDVNGALSSKTRRGDPIRLHGFFGTNGDLPVVLPISSDPDISVYRLRFKPAALPASHPRFVFQFDEPAPASPGPTVTTTLPASLFELSADDEFNLDMRLTERYDRGGRIAQSHSRWLRIQAGIRALVNFELVNETTGEPRVFQLWLRGINDAPGGVQCLPAKPLDDTILCSAGTINFATNQISVPLDPFGTGPFLTTTFSDSVTGTASVSDGVDTWTGSARIVNPELVARSNINRSLVEYTNVTFLNPLPQFTSGIVTSLNGQTFSSSGTSTLTLWDGNYLDVFNSFVQFPLDGVQPQKNAAYVNNNNGTLLGPDSFILVTGGHTYRVDYAGEAATDFHPPVRSGEMWINGMAAASFGYGTPHELTTQPITVSWLHTLATAPAETLWTVRLRETAGTSTSHVRHAEQRTERLADGEGGLTYDLAINTWTWVAPANFFVPNTGIWKINARASNASHSIRGQSQAIFVTDMTP